ncbi:hypothetical protein [Kribbella shirazensis]|uniref:Uncharacterized protein n=1 Tax=Kribbella shirazensis TaxID=1105143 RepID=A0A7X6A596_9ACTN|nr:hypothetical protein [Kribbella shirazensis]NIK62301.1 hypothetical protein [Kribbella shirazensis]
MVVEVEVFTRQQPKKRFWLLGSRDDIATVGRNLTVALGVKFVERESGYLGGAHLRGHRSGLEVTVQANFEDDDGYLTEADFRDYTTLCYITQDLTAVPLPSLTEVGIDLLRVEEL